MKGQSSPSSRRARTLRHAEPHVSLRPTLLYPSRPIVSSTRAAATGRLVSNGQTVTAGQLIARTGSTGGSTGHHLRFETGSEEAVFDPASFIRQRVVTLG
ncbi:MAG: M23 family metallopeptidase [Microbacteriaceae bacterium]|nr:M23 family metallopeptidase [Microbacteriaceae bacterium]